jgi:isopenicillin N synthase-like dioxygenase
MKLDASLPIIEDPSYATLQSIDEKNGTIPIDSHTYFMNRTLSMVEDASKINDGAAVEWTSEYGSYPTVDVSSWMNATGNPLETPVTKEQEAVVDFIVEQVTTAGSFNISGHGITQHLIDRLDATSREFFSLPIEEKERHYNAESKRGYTRIREESVASVYGYKTKAMERFDLRECYSVLNPPEHAMNASCPDEYQRVLNEYLAHMDRLDTALHMLFTAALIRIKRGVPIPRDLLETAKGGAKGLFRATHYPNLGDEYRDAVKLGAHSDWGTITIVNAPDRGLEEIRDGRWIKVPARHGELHVIVGEMAAAWTNLSFVNNVHRVNDFEGERASYVYFCGGQRETAASQRGIAPVCGPNETPRFGTVSFIEHADKYLRNYLSHSKQ